MSYDQGKQQDVPEIAKYRDARHNCEYRYAIVTMNFETGYANVQVDGDQAALQEQYLKQEAAKREAAKLSEDRYSPG